MDHTPQYALLAAFAARRAPATAQEINDAAGVDIPSLYVSLNRLVARGAVTSDGRRKGRVYQITPSGRTLAKAWRMARDV